MTQSLVSVIIPCYNAAEYVGEAIESALAQTYQNVEVIVIDDGSTDSSIDVLKSYGDQIHWETGPNRGACAARNRGIELAMGEWIQFLDADDLLDRHKLERQVPFSQQHYPDIVYVRCSSELMNDDATFFSLARMNHSDAVVLTLETILSTPGPLYPRQSLEQIGGWREELPCAQDYDLNLRLACSGFDFHELPESLVTVRRRSDSISSDYSRVLRCQEEICQNAYRLLTERGELNEERSVAFATTFTRHGRTLARLGCFSDARLRFRQAYGFHSSGGVHAAYRPWTRMVRAILGPVATECLVQARRRLSQGRSRSMGSEPLQRVSRPPE